jgi:transposase
VPAVDTNPDAAAAEAAQEAVEEPVHGQDDPVYLRAMIANRDKQLKAMTSERDKLSKELEELGVTHGILHGQFVSAIEDCDKMTSERDALKAKFDEAMGGLLRSVHNIGVDITYFKTGSPSQHQLEVTRDCMSNVIARLESK